ncbi:Isoprenylcysteine carboxyl methyltransferase family-domain-containing protein [Amylocarpus encephaloides]|uniref:Protein-S-isoprenylcysteine O-methyltransferase n=1 Tax=Amylocarpus encephaloides TaxID=45428 RepID=A0A9P7YE27_9HELO|nr:Isoprenylcysteine carboxyl methyltransferase family-domain-containing protein [Amylocarpus encephaloides]
MSKYLAMSFPNTPLPASRPVSGEDPLESFHAESDISASEKAAWQASEMIDGQYVAEHRDIQHAHKPARRGGNTLVDHRDAHGHASSNTGSWATGEDYETGQSRPDTPPRRRTPFHDSMNMLSNGGVGHAQSPPSTSSAASTPEFTEVQQAIDLYDKQFYPFQPRSLSGIAMRAFVLGGTGFSCAILALYFSTTSPLWRLPFFLAALSIFHFLEFYSTSLTNSPKADVGSFLLFSNGWQYTVAHSAAFTECLLSHLLLPSYIRLPWFMKPLVLVAGIFLVLVGQIIRTTAMIQAGPSFTHIVARSKKNTHVLITNGAYAYLRHPSYFGFFWWGIGTQLVLGNLVCLVGYSVVLWQFFSARIQGEEAFLIRFFQGDYVEYRNKTPVGIPRIS